MVRDAALRVSGQRNSVSDKPGQLLLATQTEILGNVLQQVVD
jgi:hypothetical protein